MISIIFFYFILINANDLKIINFFTLKWNIKKSTKVCPKILNLLNSQKLKRLEIIYKKLRIACYLI